MISVVLTPNILFGLFHESVNLMKKKREEKRKEPRQQHQVGKPRYWLTVILAGLIPTGLLLGAVYKIPVRFVAPPVIILLWIVASLFMWQRANARSYGDEWWQDHRRK